MSNDIIQLSTSAMVVLVKLVSGWTWHICDCPYCEMSIRSPDGSTMEKVDDDTMCSLLNGKWITPYGSYEYLLTDKAKSHIHVLDARPPHLDEIEKIRKENERTNAPKPE